MSLTAARAMQEFRSTVVDLDSAQTATARRSRDYLCEQLRQLRSKNSSAPPLTGGFFFFGSFARKTKIRPLDDIDMLVLINGRGTTEVQSSDSLYSYLLRITENASPLAPFASTLGFVNSVVVLNRLRSSLQSISNYQKAEIKRNQQAVTLNLKSYPWNFDIVPATAVNDSTGATTHYLIPDGRGNWMRTDPRRDQRNVTEANTKQVGWLLPTIRLLKYWNRRTHKPRLTPYYFETMAINVFRYASNIVSYQNAIYTFFQSCPIYLASSCPDPKNLGQALDTGIPMTIKNSVALAMETAKTAAGVAIQHELNGDHKQAIATWARIFGPDFPAYG
jgi:hypothetical protein